LTLKRTINSLSESLTRRTDKSAHIELATLYNSIGCIQFAHKDKLLGVTLAAKRETDLTPGARRRQRVPLIG
jgi:hypothetical protein